MNFEEIVTKVGIYGASLVISFVSGLLPLINTELYLVAVSAMVAQHSLLPIALLSALGQIAAKTILFYAGRGIFQINMGKFDKKIVAVQTKFKEWENKVDALILVSATVGMPPFYLVSFVAGALKLNYLRFAIAGLLGRSIRFTVIVYFPQIVIEYM